MPSIDRVNPIPTGGAFGITCTTISSGTISLSRAVSGSTSFTTLYSGPPTTTTGTGQFFLDFGDNGLLDPATFYVYRITDTIGNATSIAAQPVGQLEVNAMPTTDIVMRLMQEGLNNLATPAGIPRPTVSFAMPQASLPPLPFVVIFPVMMKQAAQKLGRDVELTDDVTNQWSINELAENMLQVTILVAGAREMLFYRDAVIGIFKTICAEVLSEIGNDVEHEWIVTATQSVGDFNNMSPGFFQMDILLKFTGIYDITITRNYGLIEHIDEKAFDMNGNLLEEAIIP